MLVVIVRVKNNAANASLVGGRGVRILKYLHRLSVFNFATFFVCSVFVYFDIVVMELANPLIPTSRKGMCFFESLWFFRVRVLLVDGMGGAFKRKR